MRKIPILHPFLFTAYPVVAFLAHNIEQTEINSALRPLLVGLASAAILYSLLKAVYRDNHRAGLLTSFLLILFFTYGHVYNAIEGFSILGMNIGRHRLLAPLWMALAGFSFWRGFQSRRDLQPLSNRANIIALIALTMPLGQISAYQISLRSVRIGSANSKVFSSAQIDPNRPLPDIYYLILDSYSRDDMLKKYYDLDNTPFIDQIEQMGFYVARCAQSNYGQSELSMASSLNYDYLDNLGRQFNPENRRRTGLADLIQHSAVRSLLEDLGYTVVATDTGYDATRLSDADIYLAPLVSAEINDFEETFLRTTAARLFIEGAAILKLPPDWEKRDQAHRERILFQLEQLRQIPAIPGPKFVFAHIITPHWPYIFGPNGEPVHEHPDSKTGYRDQVIFINRQIVPILENILATSEIPPIIVIQGDHGAVLVDPKRRMSILNAYYLPDGGDALLYEGISPVNTFRLIFNHYFGLQVPLLDDVSYYSSYEEPYNYQLVENQRKGCND